MDTGRISIVTRARYDEYVAIATGLREAADRLAHPTAAAKPGLLEHP